jgi:hypothetical protein
VNTELEEMRKQLASYFDGRDYTMCGHTEALEIADAILKETVQTPTLKIAVVEKEGKRPENPYNIEDAPNKRFGWYHAQKAMLKDGWVKEVRG